MADPAPLSFKTRGGGGGGGGLGGVAYKDRARPPPRGGNMVVLSSSIPAKVSKMSCHECKGYKWQCPTTQSPTQQHNEPQRKVWVDQVTPPPPPWERQGMGNDNGGVLTQMQQHESTLELKWRRFRQ